MGSQIPKLVMSVAAGAAPCAALAADADPVTFRGSMLWINAYVHTAANDSALNPDNRVLEVAQNKVVSEFRPNLKLLTSQFQIVARPRVTLEARRTEYGDEEGPTGAAAGDSDDEDNVPDATGRSYSEVSEAFAQWTASESVVFAYGRQSYQWGPAESLSPSNRIFHETAQNRNVLYEARGKHLARVNLSVGKWLSTVIMTEFEKNEDETPFRAEEEFQSTGLIKPEINWNGGQDYFGLVIGGREHGRGWVGQYASLAVPFIDGLAVYGDASQQKGSDAWYPVVKDAVDPTSGGPTTAVVFERGHVEDKETYTLAVGGLRYDFVHGTIVRLEYVRNDAGWDKEEREAALKAFAEDAKPAQRALTAANLPRALTPGLELPGRRYAYASVHWPDFFWIKDLTVDARGMRSLGPEGDGSAAIYGSVEYQVGDAGTIAWATSATAGDRDAELKGAAAPTHIASYKHDW